MQPIEVSATNSNTQAPAPIIPQPSPAIPDTHASAQSSSSSAAAIPAQPSGIFESVESALQSNVKKVSDLAFNTFLVPVGAGFFVGMMRYTVNLTATIGSIISTGLFHYAPKAQKGIKLLDVDLFERTIVSPICEELLLRGIVQEAVKWAFSQVLPDMDIKIYGDYQVKLATLVATLTIGILMAAIDFYTGAGVTAILSSLVSAVTNGLLKEYFGLVAPVLSGITYNTMLYAPRVTYIELN